MLVSVEEGTVATSGTPDSACTDFVAGGVYRMGSSAINTTTFAGGVAPGSLAAQSYTGADIWPDGVTKYFRVKVALPTAATESVQNMSSTLGFTFTATSPAGSTTR